MMWAYVCMCNPPTKEKTEEKTYMSKNDYIFISLNLECFECLEYSTFEYKAPDNALL